MSLTRIERKLVPALIDFERTRMIDTQSLRLAVAFGLIERISPVPLRGSLGAYLDHALSHKGRDLIQRALRDEPGLLHGNEGQVDNLQE